MESTKVSRDEFAMAAMAAIVTNGDYPVSGTDKIARISYALADSMLYVRDITLQVQREKVQNERG
jgi:hypothetical protein